MTTPDHRPYLLPTDLRTPEDVLDAMDAYHPCEEAGDVAFELRVRLDRERRQACRRAALMAWREFSYDLRRNKGHDAWVCKWCNGALTRALAFRAAARQP